VSPLVVAHRGASAHRPELTLAAFELAVAQGADGLECDVRLTADGHLVCVHDDTVDRTSSGTGRVADLTLAQLGELDFGSWHDGEHQPVLTLDALLELAVDSGRTLFIETKHPARYPGRIEAGVAAALDRFGLDKATSKDEPRVVLMSFATLSVRRMSQHLPLVPTVQLVERAEQLSPWADFAGPGVDLLRTDPGYVERCRAQGHDTYVWTVDAAEDVELCRDLGVRYLATNWPARTREHLAGVPTSEEQVAVG
jgi:glycerophosphoryl diester phosphodiesterase